MDLTLAKPPKLNDKGRTVLAIPKVRQFIDKMVEGEPLRDAALAVGLRVNRARRLMSDPAVRRHFFSEIETIRESNAARNVLLREVVRDRGFAPTASAAEMKVALTAARDLDGTHKDGSSTTVNVLNVIPGYVIDLGGEVEAPRAITNRSANDAKPLINREDVTDVEG